MKDTELYEHVLGIGGPWYVKEVKYQAKPERIDVYMDHQAGIVMPCPECNVMSPIYDHEEERVWQHLKTCQVPTYIHVRMPRVKCQVHKVRQVLNEWAESGSTMTMAFEWHLIDLEKECCIEAVSRLTGASWDRCWAVMERAVKRGLRRKGKCLPSRIGVDEKSFARRHRYETLVCDLDKGSIEYVGDDRTEESLNAYYEGFTVEEREKVRVVAMDMWEGYINATKAAIPGAEEKIVFDRFHVMRLMCEAVDKVRRQEHKELLARGEKWLKGTKYLWLQNQENMTADWRKEFASLKRQDLKVAKAWAIKENLRNLWNYTREGWAMRFFRRWYAWAIRSGLEPIRKVAVTIKEHLPNILTYLKHRVTNALTESLNGQIETVKRMACGYRNRDHYKTAIYFHCGKLDLYPELSIA